MPTATASVPTSQGRKYMRQLLNHWSHKLETELDGDRGTVRFDAATAFMAARADRLDVTIEAEDEAVLERMKGVLASHLDRFAFREAPLPFDWRAGAAA